MPNWCKGTLKIRGTISNLKKFVCEGLASISGENVLQIIDDDSLSFCVEVKKLLWIRGTHRHFVEPDYIEAYADSQDEKCVLTIPMEAAWSIDSDSLLAICKEFKIDMKIQGFERGMEFSQLIEIVDEKIIQDEEIIYKDWKWDCPCPDIGG